MGSKLPSSQGLECDENSFSNLPLTDLSSAVVPVIVYGYSYFEYIGTAFNISPDGLFITARHVVDEAVEKHAAHPGSAIAIMWIGSGEEHDDVEDLLGGPILVKHITRYDEGKSDLALLRAGIVNVKTGQPMTMPTLSLSTQLPAVGEKVCGLGYPKPTFEVDIDTPDQMAITIDQKLHASTGDIVEVFEAGRDTVMLPAAGFQTEFVLEGGMSGGPIFNQDGHVCGILSFSLRPNENYPKYTSYAALALSLFPLWLPDGTTTMTIYEMVQANLIRTDDHFNKLTYVAENGRVGVRVLRDKQQP